ncbi:MAG: sulfatase [Planctomycetes bacterium]|nr:sulfatase [Planctomycetota bacterium]
MPEPARAAAPSGAAVPHSIALLDLLAGARFAGPAPDLELAPDRWVAEPLSADAARRHEREEFDAAPTAPWFDGAWRDELLSGHAAPRRAQATAAVEGERRFAALAPADEGLHRFFAAPADATLVVRARVRVPAGATGGALFLLPHGPAAPTDAELPTALPTLPEQDLAAATARLIAPQEGGDWLDVELTLPPRAGRRSVSLSLVPSEEGLDCDFVEVREVPFTVALERAPRFAFEPSGSPWRRTLDFAQSTAEALLLPAGCRATFLIELPAAPLELCFAAGAIAPATGGDVALDVTLEGAPLFAESRRAVAWHAAQPLELRRVDLAAAAGRRVELSFAAHGPRDSVGFFAAPRLVPRDAAGSSPAAPTAVADASAPPWNVVVISLDTLRADALGCYGNATAQTPVLDALAARGARFERAFSPSSYTLPTHASLFSGQHPYVHGLLDLDDRLDPLRTPMLAERLRAAGYATAAFTGGGFVAPAFGFGAGFDLYGVDDPMGRTQLRRDRPVPPPSVRRADTPPLAPALDWLAAHAGSPFCLFLHTFFVHNYTPAREYLAPFDDPDAVVLGDDPLALRAALLAGDARAAARLRALYAATVAQVDREFVGRVVAQLEALQLLERTLVCVVADHGEEFGEHGGVGHGHALHVESTHVPWIVAGPGIAPARHADPVELADVAATLAARLGLPPDSRLLARDVFAPPADEPPPPLLVLGKPEQPTRQAALLAGPWKLMRRVVPGTEPTLALYRLDEDFAEQRDRVGEDAARRRGLEARLEAQLAALAHLARLLPSAAAPAGGQLDADARATLRELGYLDD